MGVNSEEKINKWLAAAGKGTHVSQTVRDRIILAGNFLEKTARLRDASNCLKGIDFSKPVIVVRKLPDGVYVHFKDKHLTPWFTKIGNRPDDVGISSVGRIRELYRPSGAVAALESTARSIKDTWTKSRHIDDTLRRKSLERAASMRLPMKKGDPPRTANEKEKFVIGRLGEYTSGGRIQYYVANKFQMNRISQPVHNQSLL